MSRKKRALAIGGLLAAVPLMVAGAGGASTYAAFSDFQIIEASVGAGVWAPDPPEECGDPGEYKGGIIWGTEGEDVLSGGNQSQIIMGLGGDDTITAGNSGDCIVGGGGNDQLFGGNGKDILLGGPGDDHLYGGNGKDTAYAGGDPGDVCIGGNGKDTVDCDDTNAATADAESAARPHADPPTEAALTSATDAAFAEAEAKDEGKAAVSEPEPEAESPEATPQPSMGDDSDESAADDSDPSAPEAPSVDEVPDGGSPAE
jgi:Ca2+-binding RTX toxin-like protein